MYMLSLTLSSLINVITITFAIVIDISLSCGMSSPGRFLARDVRALGLVAAVGDAGHLRRVYGVSGALMGSNVGT